MSIKTYRCPNYNTNVVIPMHGNLCPDCKQILPINAPIIENNSLASFDINNECIGKYEETGYESRDSFDENKKTKKGL